jgi:hypothetical protein
MQAICAALGGFNVDQGLQVMAALVTCAVGAYEVACCEADCKYHNVCGHGLTPIKCCADQQDACDYADYLGVV